MTGKYSAPQDVCLILDRKKTLSKYICFLYLINSKFSHASELSGRNTGTCCQAGNASALPMLSYEGSRLVKASADCTVRL
jgi:hypothetical protein